MSESEENDKLPLLPAKPIRLNYTKRYDQVSWHSADTDFEPEPDKLKKNNKKPVYSKRRKQKIAALIIVVIIFLSVMCGLIYVYVERGDDYVEIPCGKLTGVQETVTFDNIEKYFYIYKGVPYAKPPIADLRWKLPVSLDKSCWKEVLKAKSFKKSCIGGFGENLFGSEDCLYLNVYTPIEPKGEGSLPVIVYFQSELSSQNIDNQNSFSMSATFVAEMEAVLVSVSFRKDAFGFLSLKELTNFTGQYGNLGISDQLLALDWVQKNIKAFGGDASSVTVLGRTSVIALMASPKGKGMFNKAVIFGASPNFNITYEEAFSINKELLNAGKCKSQTGSKLKECLYSLSAAEVQENFFKNSTKRWDFPKSNAEEKDYLVILEPKILPILPQNLKNTDHDSKVSVLIGSTDEEIALKSHFRPTTFVELDSFLSKQGLSADTMTSINQLYANHSSQRGNVSATDMYQIMTSDMRVICPTNLLMEEMEKSKNHLFYRYVLESSGEDHLSHGAGFQAVVTMTENNNQLSKVGKRLRKNLKHFLKYGHPVELGWDSDKSAIFDTNGNAKILETEYHNEQCKFWNDPKNEFARFAWRN